MDFLQEKLLGEKVAVSPILLALAQNIHIDEAERVLTEFYETHKSSLDASFQVTTKNGIKTSIKTTEAAGVPKEALSKRIYVVCPERAADPVVINEVASRVSELQLQLRIGDLRHAGLCVNPLLDEDFTVRTANRLFGPLSVALGNQAPRSTVAPQAPKSGPTAGAKSGAQPGVKPEAKSEAQPGVKPEAKSEARSPAPPVKQEAAEKNPSTTKPAEVKEEAKPPQKRPNPKPPQRSAKKSPAFPFAKVNKAEALASNRQQSRLPVHEKVVISEDHDGDDFGSDEADEELTQRPSVSKAKQLENLQKLYEEDVMNVDANEAPETDTKGKGADGVGEDAMEVDEDLENQYEENPYEEEQEPDMDMEPLEASAPPSEETSTNGNNKDSEESPAAPENASEQKPRTRKVLKTIVTKDEEGFDVRQQVYVDEEIDPSEASAATNKPDTQRAASEKQTNNTEEPKPRERKSKAPPTIKKGNQTNLMSFFSKGK